MRDDRISNPINHLDAFSGPFGPIFATEAMEPSQVTAAQGTIGAVVA
jgi:hypothetical protein